MGLAPIKAFGNHQITANYKSTELADEGAKFKGNPSIALYYWIEGGLIGVRVVERQWGVDYVVFMAYPLQIEGHKTSAPNKQ